MHVMNIPFVNGNTEGCKIAGDLIFEELKNLEINEKEKLVNVSLLDIEKINLDNLDLNSQADIICEKTLKSLEEKDRAIFLGGDHSGSYFFTKSFLEYCRKKNKHPCLVVFDSRPNCKNVSCEVPTNEEWLKNLVEDGFPKENILLVGVRNYSYDELAFLKRNEIKIMKMNQILENREDSCDIIMEFSRGKELYISIDVGVLDSVFVPGVFSSEVGGLSPRELIYFLQRLNILKNLKAIDVVEINPEIDSNNFCVKVGAKILSELI